MYSPRAHISSAMNNHLFLTAPVLPHAYKENIAVQRTTGCPEGRQNKRENYLCQHVNNNYYLP